MKIDSIAQQKFDLFYELLRTGFRLRYNDSILGVFWVVARPLINFIVLFFVFSHLKAVGAEYFELYLLTGIIMYSYFSESVLTGAGSLLGMAHIILKVRFPKQVAVLSVQGLATIGLLINLGILAVFAIVRSVDTNIIAIIYFLCVIIILTLMTYSISLFTSVLSVRFRDVKNLIEVFLQIGFYLSPVFYSIEIIPLRYRAFIEYNPMTIIIQTSRAAVIYGEIINVKAILALMASSIILMLFGRIVFNKLVKKVAEYY